MRVTEAGPRPEEATPRGSASVVEQLFERRRKRRRRRVVSWIVFVLCGSMLGTTWAIGYSSVTMNQSVASPDGDVILGGSGGGSTGRLANSISQGLETVVISWMGLWGDLKADHTLWRVTTPAGSGTYFVDIYLTNNPTGWTALQFEFRMKEVAALTDCNGADAEGAEDFGTNDTKSDQSSATWTTNPKKRLTVDAEDVYVSFTGLAANKIYCIGLADTETPGNQTANNQYATFLRRPTNTTTPVDPTFVAMVNQSS